MSIHGMRKWMQGWFHYVMYALAIVFVVGFIGIAIGGNGALNNSQSSTSGVVAKVNGQKIVSEKFEMAVQKESEMYEQMGQQLGPFEQVQLRLGVLDRMVNQKLMVLAAKKENVKVSKKEINSKVDEYIKQEIDQYRNAFLADSKGPKTDKALEAEFAKRQKGLTLNKVKTDIRKNIDRDAVRDQLMMEKLQKVIEAKVDTSEEALKASYDEVKFSQITVDAVKRSDSEAKAKARELVQKLRAGEEFAKVAADNSDDPYAKNGGDRDMFMGHAYMEPELEKVAFKLKKDEISDPIKMPQGYMIIKVMETRNQLPKDFNDPKKHKEYMDSFIASERSKTESAFFESMRSSAKIDVIDPELKAHYAMKDIFSAKNETERKTAATKAINAYKKALSDVSGESTASARIYSQMVIIYNFLSAPSPGNENKQEQDKYRVEAKNSLVEALNYTESNQLRLMLAKMHIEDKETEKAIENLELVSDNSYDDPPQTHMQILMLAEQMKDSSKASKIIANEKKWMDDYEKQMKEQQQLNLSNAVQPKK